MPSEIVLGTGKNKLTYHARMVHIAEFNRKWESVLAPDAFYFQ